MADVILYHSPGCPPCHKVMEYLSSKEIAYDSRDISENPTYRNELMELGSMGTPTLKIGDQVIIGFNQAKIDSALASA